MSIDSNVIDLLDMAFATRDHADACEACDPPPPFDVPAAIEPEVRACFWLIAHSPYWRSVLYTFSDTLYAELNQALHGNYLLQIAIDFLGREDQPSEYRVPAAALRPSNDVVASLGVRGRDIEHVADAVGMSCDYLLTNDRQLRNRSDLIESRWRLRVRRPSEFLTEAVRSGAPWTTSAPWPWETPDP